MTRNRVFVGLVGACLVASAIGLGIGRPTADTHSAGAASSVATSPVPSSPVLTPPGTVQPAPSASPLPDPVDVTAPPITGTFGTFSDQHVQVSIRLNSSIVVPAAAIAIDVTITSHSPGRILFDSVCSPAAMAGLVPMPIEPRGAAWSGIAAKLKDYAATSAFGPQTGGPGSYADPIRIEAARGDCARSAVLDPGATSQSSLRWTAWLARPWSGLHPERGIAAPAGPVAYQLRIDYLPLPPLGGLTLHHTITMPGTLTVSDRGPRIISVFEALDAVLANDRFSRWLAREPSSSWVGMSFFLRNPSRRDGIVPAGPSWGVELERRVNAIGFGFVDPYTGRVRSVVFCPPTCE